jgi:acylphosphatase
MAAARAREESWVVVALWGRNQMQRMPFLCRLEVVLVSTLCVNVPIHAVEDKPPETGKAVYYSGRVQGVGFRAATTAIAKKYAVTGWVKNLKDGRVQLVVEGSEEEVKNFLKAVREHWKKNIEKEATEKREPTGKYKTFEVAVK